MFGYIQEFTEVRQIQIVSALHTGQIKPAEFYRENVLQKRCQEEGGHGNADHGDHRGEIVGKAVLLLGSSNAQRNGNEDLENERDQTEDKTVPDGIVELLRDRKRPGPAVAPLTLHGMSQPHEITLNYALVHTVLRVQVGQPLRIAFGSAGAGSQFARLCLNIAHGHVVHQHIDDKHHEEQNQNAV